MNHWLVIGENSQRTRVVSTDDDVQIEDILTNERLVEYGKG
jgi:hypothetical protein